MRLRKKPWARGELEACDIFVSNPVDNIGKWHCIFEKPQEIWLELGCGKGGFISQLAPSRPDINFMAIDIKDEMLIIAKEKIEKEYAALNLLPSNVRIMSHEIMIIKKMMNADDVVERIYINFCNPWHKNTHRARRLTHSKQLSQYREFLSDEGKIFFKTDDDILFNDSLRYFKQSGFKIDFITEDLCNSGYKDNIETEHEKFYVEMGKNIMFLIASKV